MKLLRPSTHAVLLLIAVLPLPALAHTGVDAGLHHGLAAGFLHPLTGADHLAAMVAVGLWSALAARRWLDLLAAPAAFALMLLGGALLGMAGVQVPAVESSIAVSLLVLGLLVMTQLHLPASMAGLLVGLFALFHGHAHGRELAGGSDTALALGGMLAASLLLHGSGVGLGVALRRARPWWPRLAGLVVVVCGAALLSARA
ncbi:HupE/UreJ family protein [Variovorax sp. M-6]|uniref:HupE/UreJ family protein n=1 Tax=Variovorax sp. M-6 TaxID=3233041 RepID=UPI003F9B907B